MPVKIRSKSSLNINYQINTIIGSSTKLDTKIVNLANNIERKTHHKIKRDGLTKKLIVENALIKKNTKLKKQP